MPPPSVSPPTPVVEMMPPVVARPNGYPAAFRSPQVAPPSTRAVRVSGSTRTPRMVERSTTSASSAVPKPGTLCDPPRTATVRSFSAANRTAAITSPVLAGRTITAGRRSIMALYTRRASSYSASSAVVTVPRTLSRRAVSAFVSMSKSSPRRFTGPRRVGPRSPRAAAIRSGVSMGSIHARPARQAHKSDPCWSAKASGPSPRDRHNRLRRALMCADVCDTGHHESAPPADADGAAIFAN